MLYILPFILIIAVDSTIQYLMPAINESSNFSRILTNTTCHAILTNPAQFTGYSNIVNWINSNKDQTIRLTEVIMEYQACPDCTVTEQTGLTCIECLSQFNELSESKKGQINGGYTMITRYRKTG